MKLGLLKLSNSSFIPHPSALIPSLLHSGDDWMMKFL
jgi:hypothetical protein